MAYIYLINFSHHPNLHYVGKTTRNVEKRFREHFTGSQKNNKTSKMCHWYKNNKIELTYTILEETNRGEVDWLEIFWIRYLKYLGISLTNHHDNETISVDWTDQRKKKMSEFRKSHKFSEDVKCRMSESKMGRNITWGDKISETKKGKSNPFTPTHKKNLAESRKVNQGRRVTMIDNDGNMLHNFITIGEAAEYVVSLKPNLLGKLNNIRNGIKDCCTGKQQTSYGFIWTYTERLEGKN